MSHIKILKFGEGNLAAEGRGGISACLMQKSFAPDGTWVTTYALRYPRFIHSEVMTHRVFSRNAASSRAIPVAKMIAQVRDDPAMPIHWGKNQPGMQAKEELNRGDLLIAQDLWFAAAENAAKVAQQMNELGAHKQVANRILEPFQFMHTIVTSTDWDNFFALRCHLDAQPEIQELANCIKALHDISANAEDADLVVRTMAVEGWTPLNLFMDERMWHLPYVTRAERRLLPVPVSIMASAARCARVSYLTHDGDVPDLQKDIALFMRLVGSEPLHASPIEHQAVAAHSKRSNNFSGCFVQFRELYENNAAVRDLFKNYEGYKP